MSSIKKIAVTQRVENVTDYKEIRDALDQRWVDLLLECSLFPVIVPNNKEYIKHLFYLHPDISGIILTGGNDLSKYYGSAPERDEIETHLINYAIEKDLPLFGVCRGMQMIQDYFDVSLVSVNNHVRVKHSLNVNQKSKFNYYLKSLEQVNTFHKYAAFDTNQNLIVSARSLDDVIMAIEHHEYRIFAQMWHSEREFPFIKKELELIKKIFQT